MLKSQLDAPALLRRHHQDIGTGAKSADALSSLGGLFKKKKAMNENFVV